MTNIRSLVDNIVASNNVSAQEKIADIMAEKLQTLLDLAKIEVAQGMFNTCEDCSQETITQEQYDGLTEEEQADFELIDEALQGNQHKIDTNKNGKVDAHDFKLLRKKKGVKEEVEQVDELSKQALSTYIKKAGPQIAGLEQKHGITSKPAMKRKRGVTRASINYLKKDLGMPTTRKEEVAQEAYSDPYAAKKSAEMKKAHASTMADAKKEYDAARKPKFAKNFMKMKKEDVNLQELDADTLRSYISKRAKPGQLDAARKGDSTAKKQVKGISNANASLTKKYKSKMGDSYNNAAAASYNKAKPGTYHGD